MKVMIIDDEYYAIEALAFKLKKIKDVEIVGTFQEVTSALDQINELRPDLVFLDIQMPEITGLEGFGKIKEINEKINIVYVTAYDDYALKAFEQNAIDYLLKPVSEERLIKTLKRITEKPMYGNHGEGEYADREYVKNVPVKEVWYHCFRSFDIMVDGKSLNIEWRTRKAEELLAFLIVEKGRFVAKEKLAEVLWPEMNRDNAMANFYIAQHYLKKQEKTYNLDFHIISVRGKVRVDYEKMNVDIKVFDKANEAYQGGDTEGAKLALEVYKGDLLEEKYYSWGSEAREKYHRYYEEIKG